MVSLKTMLYPTDLSIYSKSILQYADDFSSIGVERVALLFVINTAKISGVAGGIDIDKYIDEESKKADEGLPIIAEVLERVGINVEIIKPYPTGDPTAEILNYSEHYDFVSMGSHGYGFLRGLLMGSVSEGVVRRSKVPVYIFKFRMERRGKSIKCIKCHANLFDRILVAYDFSNHANKALEYAKYVADRVNSEIYVVHAAEPGCKGHDIENLVDRLSNEGYNAHGRVVPGSPHKVILKLADEVDATTIFMGSRGLGTVRSLLMGSTSDSVIRHAPIPVFVCREVERDER